MTIHNSKTVAEAAKLMAEHSLSALVIINRKHVFKGLLTTRELTQRYLNEATEPPTVALAENYANQTPLMLPLEYPITETLAEMLRTGENYCLVTRNNRPVGIITKANLLALMASNNNGYGAYVSAATTIQELKRVVDELPKVVENVMNNTSIFREILPALSMHHILIQKHTFELAKHEYKRTNKDFTPIIGEYCLVTLGALARREMTLAKTQSHLIVLKNGLSSDTIAHYKAFAKLFADMLEELGYEGNPLGMSLLNTEMVKTIDEWREQISVGIHKSNKTNLLHTRQLFDCKRVEGAERLLWEFRDAISATVREKSLLFGRLIDCQQAAKIPVSQFGSFITEKDGALKDTIDLEENGLNFIAYTAQAFALSVDLQNINTVRRLENLRHSGGIAEGLTRESISAYESLLDLALHEQLSQIAEGKKPTFRLYPANLSMHAQERLKRALHVAARLFGAGLTEFK
jgi:signal-transduction protein with cAMP-binding, CBS, and nucleotidyltransferase domain